MTKLTNLHQKIAEELVKTRKLVPSSYWFEVINDFILHLAEMFESNSSDFDQEEFLTICEMEEEWSESSC